MAKLILDSITSGYRSAEQITNNNSKIVTAIENTLSRDGTSPNFMEAPIDMNGNFILNQGNPITVSGFNWEGPWVTGTLYQVGDVIQTNNSSYICIVEHTAGVFATDLAAGKWQVVASSAALPSQAGHGGDILSTDGSTAAWVDVNTLALPITGGALTGALDGTDIVLSGTLSVAGASTFTNTVAISGMATAPTPATTDISTNIATTQFVVNKLLAAPVFRAAQSSSQAITTSTNTKIVFGTEEYDSNNNFASSRFTPTVAGYYQFDWGIGVSATLITNGYSMLYINGSEADRGTQITLASGAAVTNYRSVGSTIIRMNGTTDYAEIWIFYTGTALSASYNRFSGCLIRTM